MAGGRCLGITANVFPRHLGAAAYQQALGHYPLFPSIADHYEQLCTPFHRCQSVETNNESEVGHMTSAQ